MTTLPPFSSRIRTRLPFIDQYMRTLDRAGYNAEQKRIETCMSNPCFDNRETPVVAWHFANLLNQDDSAECRECNQAFGRYKQFEARYLAENGL